MEVGCNFRLIADPKVVFGCNINFRQLVDGGRLDEFEFANMTFVTLV